ncbi:MAG TPA: hypothetical protein VFM09_03395 [Marmoricola sp.]|nr:hypothetical protein [Marmoricola sp.]
MRIRTTLAVLASGALLAGCGSAPADTGKAQSGPAHGAGTESSTVHASKLPWNRPDDQQAQVKAAGLSLTTQEQLQVHYHAHLDVFVDGKPVPVPPGLGINIGPNNTMPAHGQPGIAPLHTHDSSGVLHIEAAKDDTFTLGQAFVEWGVLLDKNRAGAYTPVRAYVDGKRYAGDPAGIVLKAHQEIAVVAGKGDVKVPRSYNFPQGE